MTELTHAEIRRYARHLTLPEFGIAAQRRLKQSSVLLIGAGGLGSPLALYLAAAGIGTIGVVDFDVVDESNLQRQIIHGTAAIGTPKTASASARLRDLNPYTAIIVHETRLTSANALEVMRPYDLIVDGTDNFPTRYLTSDACVLLGKPNIYGAIYRFEGQVTVFAPHLGGPCYRCLYPEPPPPGLVPSCAEGGVLGVLPGVIGTIQATEAVKLLTAVGEPLLGRLLLYDAFAMRFDELRVRRNPACPVCGPHPSVTALIDYEQFCGIIPASAPMTTINDLTPSDVAARIARPEPPLLLDVREAHEWAIGHLPGAVRIALGELPARLGELDPTRETVVYCRSGARSAQAAALLRTAGFHQVHNMLGGTLRWSDDVDPSVPKY
jgi:sulfur-carrier protein adenylyltransferase/sulfurtransferase